METFRLGGACERVFGKGGGGKGSPKVLPAVLMMAVSLVAATLTGCATNDPEDTREEGFFTSGNPSADRRAVQIVAENEKDEKEEEKGAAAVQDAKLTDAPKQTLYDRLGREEGIRIIVDDFVKRAMEDPRVNWSREGITKGGWFQRDTSVTWEATPENVRRMKEHFVQFISLASGGPVEYDGKEIQPTHADMKITAPEFDAAIGDLKATLDKLGVEPDIQKELLAVFESTRPLIVLER